MFSIGIIRCMYPSAITVVTMQSRVMHCNTGLTHHRRLCPESGGLSALCSKVGAEGTYEKRKRFLELRDLLFGEGVCLYSIDSQRSAYPGGTPKRGVYWRGGEFGSITMLFRRAGCKM